MKKAVLLAGLFILVGGIGWTQIINDIFDAISYGTADDLRTMIEKGFDVNQLNEEYGITPLQIAARDSDDPEKFRLLLNAGSKIDPVEYYNYDTPFELILKKDNIELVRLFIDAGADIHRVDKWGRTPLEYAAFYSSDPEIFRLLINRGANVNRGGKGTPLHSVANSKPENVVLLIELGADVNARDTGGNTPLMCSVGSYECVDVLLKAGANINLQNKDGKTALIIAAQYGGDPRVITLLLQNGANAKFEDNTGRTALDWFDLNKNLNRYHFDIFTQARKELKDKT